jgi:hypothetical protein
MMTAKVYQEAQQRLRGIRGGCSARSRCTAAALLGALVLSGFLCDAHAAPQKRRPPAAPTVAATAEEQVGFSRRIDDLFSRAITALREGRADEFRSMLSSSTIDRETRGSGAIDKVIRTRFIPFFAGMKKLTATSASIPTQDPEGHKGIALGHSFLTHDGDERSFVMYIVEEDGELVVSNLLLDKTIADLK